MPNITKMLNKRAVITSGILTTAVLGIVLLVVLLNVYSSIVPEAQASGDSLGNAAVCSDAGGFFNSTQGLCLNGTNPADTATVNFAAIPLSGLFSGTGVVFVIIIAALIILVVKSYLQFK